MKQKTKELLGVTGFFWIISIVFTVFVKFMDVSNAVYRDSLNGLTRLNIFFSKLIGHHENIYLLTEILGLISFSLVGLFGMIGLVQLLKRKSIMKVDKIIINLGITYIITGAIYILFNNIAINYRPIIAAGENDIESSFPSSHTILAIVIWGTTIIISRFYLKKENSKVYKYIVTAAYFLLAIIVAGRFISGVHWFTDIIGGIFYGVALVSTFTFLNAVNKQKS